ncbi:hypothetical protein [Paenibacillus sp. TSA_86.1]|uniref:hypothetical protein n=1 Tax=Paenibacillus sp. TSA_86.1 TaxID=3415649 RepID=UPI0040465466
MDTTNSIRKKLMQYIHNNDMRHSHFANQSGINSGTLSRILQGNKPISMNQLQAITAGMGLAEDYFFIDYIEECFSSSVSIRRIRPFLFRCADLKRVDCIQQITIRILEDLSYTPVLFDIAGRPIYYYILYAYLARATASEECGNYKRALEFVALYAHGESWIREKDEEATRIIGQFTEWAVANTYLYRLMSGEVDVLNEYVEYIAIHEDEIFIALWHILQAANIYHLNIDSILERFNEYIPYQSGQTEFGEYEPTILKESYVQFLAELAMYQLNECKDAESATKLMLEGLNLSVAMGSRKIINSCLAYIEKISR